MTTLMMDELRRLDKQESLETFLWIVIPAILLAVLVLIS